MSTQPRADAGRTAQGLERRLSELTQYRAEDRKLINELFEEIERLNDRVDELESRAPTPGEKEYAAMDKSDKATVIREKLYNEATGTNGKAKVGYKDVIRMFDGEPSPGHAYDLMEKAANRD